MSNYLGIRTDDPTCKTLTVTGLQYESTQDNIVAFATGGQAGGTAITAMNGRVTTVATAGDSVKLMPSAMGLIVYVTNAAANSTNVFPATGDQINTLGANAAFALAAGKTCGFICYSAGQWHTLLTA